MSLIIGGTPVDAQEWNWAIDVDLITPALMMAYNLPSRKFIDHGKNG